MSRVGCYGGRALARSDIPAWMRVDSDGRIWTSHNRGGYPAGSERRAERSTSRGYLDVRLAGEPHLAHRVVYAWFWGEAPTGVLVRHLDDNRHNNRPSNLALGDNLANMRDAVLAGAFTGDHARGELNVNAKLTEADIREIRAAYRAGEKQVPLARRFGVRQSTIWAIVRGKTWAHV